MGITPIPSLSPATSVPTYRCAPSPVPAAIQSNQGAQQDHHLWDTRFRSTGQSFSSKPLWSKHPSCSSVHLSSRMIFFYHHPTIHPSGLASSLLLLECHNGPIRLDRRFMLACIYEGEKRTKDWDWRLEKHREKEHTVCLRMFVCVCVCFLQRLTALNSVIEMTNMAAFITF